MLAKRSRATVPCAAAYSQSGASFAASRYALAAMIPYLTTSISLAAKPKTESGAVGALRGLRAPRHIPEAALCEPCAAAPRITIRFNAASCQDKNRTPPVPGNRFPRRPRSRPGSRSAASSHPAYPTWTPMAKGRPRFARQASLDGCLGHAGQTHRACPIDATASALISPIHAPGTRHPTYNRWFCPR